MIDKLAFSLLFLVIAAAGVMIGMIRYTDASLGNGLRRAGFIVAIALGSIGVVCSVAVWIDAFWRWP